MSSAPLGPDPDPALSEKVVAIDAARKLRSVRARPLTQANNSSLQRLASQERSEPSPAAGRLAAARAAAGASVFGGRDDARNALVGSLGTALASCRALLHLDEDLFADVTGWERELTRLEALIARSYGRSRGIAGGGETLDRAAFEAHLRAALRDGRNPVSVLAIDIDRPPAGLDALLDREAGDGALDALVARIRTCLGTGDVLAAGLDGADLAVAAIGCGLLPAVVLGERIRIAAEGCGPPGLTVSIGVATLRPTEELGAFALRVGAALEVAKRAGRNRVEADAGG